MATRNSGQHQRKSGLELVSVESVGLQAAITQARMMGAALVSDKKNPISVDADLDLRGIEEIDMPNVFNVAEGKQIIIGGLSRGVYNANVTLGYVQSKTGASKFWEKKDVPHVKVSGVKGCNFNNCNIGTIEFVANELIDDEKSNGYINVYGGLMANINISAGGEAWSNALNFWGTRMQTLFIPEGDRINDIYISRPTFEGAEVDIRIEQGDDIRIIEARLETNQVVKGIYFGEKTSNCVMTWGFNSSAEHAIQVVSSAPKPIVDLGNNNSVHHSLLDSADRQSYTFDVKRNSIALDENGVVSAGNNIGWNVINGQLEKTQGVNYEVGEGLIVPQGSCVWVGDVMPANSGMLMRFNAEIAAASCRLRVFCYDADMKLIDQANIEPNFFVFGIQEHANGVFVQANTVGNSDLDNGHKSWQASLAMIQGTDIAYIIPAIYAQLETEIFSCSVDLWTLKDSKGIEQKQRKTALSSIAKSFGVAGDSVNVKGSGSKVYEKELETAVATVVDANNITVTSWASMAEGDAIKLIKADQSVIYGKITAFPNAQQLTIDSDITGVAIGDAVKVAKWV